MWDWDDVYAEARYNSFQVTSKQDGFRLLGSIDTLYEDNYSVEYRVIQQVVPNLLLK